MATLDDFFAALSRRMGWEPTPWRIGVLKEMARLEGYPSAIRLEQTWNPLDTTMPAQGATNWNSVGVKVYPNLATGVEATAQTLEQGGYYPNLVRSLADQRGYQEALPDLQTWGWAPETAQGIINYMNGTQGGGTMAAPAQEQTAPSKTKTWLEFLKEQGFVTTYTDPQTGESFDEIMDIPAAMLMDLRAEFKGTTAGQEPMTAYQQADIGIRQAGLASDWYQDKVSQYDRIVAAGLMTRTQAQEDLDHLLQLKQEETARYGYATQRGGDVLSTLEERAGRTLPMAQWPGSEPGGFMAGVAAKYGLPAPPPIQGVPVENFPNPWEVYAQANQAAGLPASISAPGEGMTPAPSYTAPPPPEVGYSPYAASYMPPTTNNAPTYSQDDMDEAKRLLAQAQARKRALQFPGEW